MNPRVPKSCRVYTPSLLASAIVGAMRDKPTDEWLEPCFGKGAFLRALSRIGVSPRRILAVDLDKTPSDADALAITQRGTEFLEWSLATDCTFSKIVANPPFVSFRRLSGPLHSVASRLNCRWAGPATGNSNLWFAFLRASLSLLKRAGSIGFIVPAAFEYADYASTLRKTIHEHFAEFEVHRCRKPLFEEVQDGCVVLIGQNYEFPNHTNIRREYGSAEELIREFGRFGGSKRSISAASERKDGHLTVKVSKVLTVRIGCVTGDAQYFLLREPDRIRLGLPVRVLRPVLTRSRHLKTAIVTSTVWKRLKDRHERVWLFRPHQRDVKLPSVRNYLRLSSAKGGCNRNKYKIRIRKLWYRPDLPGNVQGFLSGSSKSGPWISLQQYERLSATNTLYCVCFNDQLSQSARAAWALSFLTSQFRRQLPPIMRMYPDGLVKVEPGDLMALNVPIPRRIRGAVTAYRRAIRLLLNEGSIRAQKFADAWFAKM